MVQALIAQLGLGRRPPSAYELAAVDSMVVSLPATRRHQCTQMNSTTVGGGVLWAFFLEARAGCNPIQILKVLSGAWHDSRVIKGVTLAAQSVVYLMDRGFYSLCNVEEWLRQEVHFIVRARRREFVWEAVEVCGPERLGQGGVWIKFDGVARLGSLKRRGPRPVVRLVYAIRPDGEDLILVSDLMDWSAEKILASYKMRWQIEGFHKFIKETIGLAHLYNFRQNGLLFLLHVAALLAMLLFLGKRGKPGLALEVMQEEIKALRHSVGVWECWKSNTHSRCKRKKSKTRTPELSLNH